MATFSIRVVNSDFETCNDVEAPDLEHARAHGLRAALGIGSDELCKGTQFFGAEIRVEIDGEVQQRLVLAMGASPLQ